MDNRLTPKQYYFLRELRNHDKFFQDILTQDEFLTIMEVESYDRYTPEQRDVLMGVRAKFIKYNNGNQ